MRRKTVIDSVLTMMEGSYDPSLITEDSVGMTNDYNGGESVDATMLTMPGNETSEIDMDMGRCEENEGFSSDDYICAKELIHRVGNIERVRELLTNLEEVEETLDIEPSDVYDISDIADQMPDDPDLPTSKHADMSALYDPSHTDM